MGGEGVHGKKAYELKSPDAAWELLMQDTGWVSVLQGWDLLIQDMG